MRDKVFIIAKTPKYVGYQRGLPSIIYKCFDKDTAGRAIKNGNILKKELAKELHKPINRKFEKRKVHPSFIDNIWVADLAGMQLISNYNKGFLFYFVLLTFIANMCGLFFFKIKQVL